ncbi:S8 family serine peptidase [Sinomicrobium weinanense]|uniref:S8 family serine peptidase n=1 Tax=Sinomicrobium weinanense TaxID=2842200 RepID=A0A926JUD4_9FLAO|nr:S8 family serine peptidase [Sinomicrobium weinanense]MBC9797715.1 S8 family serine peptidase [Sinomicrobium weinanense]MBU3122259.1 S8 family serine peptidase [Sinomicrobium weinanense]
MKRTKHPMVYILRPLWLVFILIILEVSPTGAQERDAMPDNWHLLDFEEDNVYGISMEKAYRELLTGKVPDTVIVAVIDSGIDTLHTDLRAVLWKNNAEQGNDEDSNGYIGDRYGWNFLGGKDKKNVDSAPPEFIRQYFWLRGTYEGKAPGDIPRKQRREYQLWKQIRDKFRGDSLELVTYYQKTYQELEEGNLRIQEVLDRQEYTASNLSTMDKSQVGEGNRMYRKLMSRWTKENTTNIEILTDWRNRMEEVEQESRFSYAAYAPKANLRQEIIGDNYYNFKDKYYGNPFVQDGIGSHGTHVAGIIGAIRNNEEGINGIVNAVKLMILKAVPAKGDEYDKDIALAIRYAVDNGAKIINMSFAKDFSPEREWVEQAIRYAKRKDVLLINGAGNDGRNVDTVPKYPISKPMNKKKRFSNMITVGASGPTEQNLITDFSNYGQNVVDVFAPGYYIYSTVERGYKKLSGTSMASPVVTGIAAVLRSYYPKLSARQVKEIIEKSVIHIDQPVLTPGFIPEKRDHVMMDQLCKTGGIVNAYKAIELAESISK